MFSLFGATLPANTGACYVLFEHLPNSITTTVYSGSRDQTTRTGRRVVWAVYEWMFEVKAEKDDKKLPATMQPVEVGM
jgi:hypothetical protein